MGKFRKNIWLILGIMLAVIIAVNFNFIYYQAKFIFFSGKKQIYEFGPRTAQTKKIVPNILIIESLNLNLPVVYGGEKTETAFQEALKNGVVLYPGTAFPGEVGNAYIFGHSSDYVWAKGNYKTAFALLPRIDIGAKIILSNQQGKPFIYYVKESFSVPANAIHLLSQNTGGKKILTLQTSWPLGTALKRWIVRAEIE